MADERCENFEDLAWLFQCDSRNRGIIAQGFDEAALLWKAVKATAGDILEIGRKRAGSTVVLAAAGPGRKVVSLDLRLRPHRMCKAFFDRPENRDRIHLEVANSRVPLPGSNFGLLFIDGDHSFEGVLADVMAHWNSLHETNGRAGLGVFHDALPNDNFAWRDEGRRVKRFWTRVKNKFRSQKKPEVAQDYSIGVNRVCEKLVAAGLAERWGAASSVLVLRKIGDLPANFLECFEKTR
jgi:hypothetical protein